MQRKIISCVGLVALCASVVVLVLLLRPDSPAANIVVFATSPEHVDHVQSFCSREQQQDVDCTIQSVGSLEEMCAAFKSRYAAGTRHFIVSGSVDWVHRATDCEDGSQMDALWLFSTRNVQTQTPDNHDDARRLLSSTPLSQHVHLGSDMRHIGRNLLRATLRVWSNVLHTENLGRIRVLHDEHDIESTYEALVLIDEAKQFIEDMEQLYSNMAIGAQTEEDIVFFQEMAEVFDVSQSATLSVPQLLQDNANVATGWSNMPKTLNVLWYTGRNMETALELANVLPSNVVLVVHFDALHAEDKNWQRIVEERYVLMYKGSVAWDVQSNVLLQHAKRNAQSLPSSGAQAVIEVLHALRQARQFGHETPSEILSHLNASNALLTAHQTLRKHKADVFWVAPHEKEAFQLMHLLSSVYDNYTMEAFTELHNTTAIHLSTSELAEKFKPFGNQLEDIKSILVSIEAEMQKFQDVSSECFQTLPGVNMTLLKNIVAQDPLATPWNSRPRFIQHNNVTQGLELLTAELQHNKFLFGHCLWQYERLLNASTLETLADIAESGYYGRDVVSTRYFFPFFPNYGSEERPTDLQLPLSMSAFLLRKGGTYRLATESSSGTRIGYDSANNAYEFYWSRTHHTNLKEAFHPVRLSLMEVDYDNSFWSLDMFVSNPASESPIVYNDTTGPKELWWDGKEFDPYPKSRQLLRTLYKDIMVSMYELWHGLDEPLTGVYCETYAWGTAPVPMSHYASERGSAKVKELVFTDGLHLHDLPYVPFCQSSGEFGINRFARTDIQLTVNILPQDYLKNINDVQLDTLARLEESMDVVEMKIQNVVAPFSAYVPLPFMNSVLHNLAEVFVNSLEDALYVDLSIPEQNYVPTPDPQNVNKVDIHLAAFDTFLDSISVQLQEFNATVVQPLYGNAFDKLIPQLVIHGDALVSCIQPHFSAFIRNPLASKVWESSEGMILGYNEGDKTDSYTRIVPEFTLTEVESMIEQQDSLIDSAIEQCTEVAVV